jgi:ABC-type branched-subunit amino acid transport system ATPase component
VTGIDVVRLENVWVSYNGTSALEGINLRVDEHDFLGIIGPNVAWSRCWATRRTGAAAG